MSGCINTLISCDDSDACTTDNCDPITGCDYTPVNCDDGTACTTDGCDPTDGCTSTSVLIDISIAPPSAVIAAGDSISLAANSSVGNLSYSWSPSRGLSCDDCDSLQAFPDTTTSYNLVVSDQNGCTATAGILIVVTGKDTVDPSACLPSFFVPNAFTPNGDGINDKFYVYGRGIEEMHLQIFNRWGELIFESDDQTDGWDGTYRGEVLNPDVFVYYVKIIFCDDSRPASDNSYRKGSLTLIR